MAREKREDNRLMVAWTAELHTDSGVIFDCQVRDVSLHGALVYCNAPLACGDEVLLRLRPVGDFAARVVWQSGESCGLWLLAGPDLQLKKFAEPAGSSVSHRPEKADK